MAAKESRPASLCPPREVSSQGWHLAFRARGRERGGSVHAPDLLRIAHCRSPCTLPRHTSSDALHLLNLHSIELARWFWEPRPGGGVRDGKLSMHGQVIARALEQFALDLDA